MYEYLTPGTVRRTFTDSNLSLINTDADRFMKVAGGPVSLAQTAGPITLTAPVVTPVRSIGAEPTGLAGQAAADRIDAAIEAIVEETYLAPFGVGPVVPGTAGQLDDQAGKLAPAGVDPPGARDR